MATVNKILIDGVGIDLTDDTVSASVLRTGYTAHDASGNVITGSYAGIVPSGNKAITATTGTQTAIDVTSYATVSVAPTPSEEKSVTTNGDVTPTSGKLLSKVSVNVPTGTARTSSDLTVSGNTITAPAGLYSSPASKSVATGTQGTPTVSKSISGNTATVTPSCTDTTGYIAGATKTGTAVTVTASELVSGSESITANGTYDITNKASAVVNVAVPDVWTTTFTLATHQSTTVTLCTLPDSVYSHIDDTNFTVTIICTDPSLLVQYDEYSFMASNNSSLPTQGTYPVYGSYCRKTGATTVSQKPAYYPPSDTTSSTSLGASKVFHTGNVLKYQSSNYYLGAGTHEIVISW